MAARKKPSPPHLSQRQWEVIADALDSHKGMLESHDEEWEEDLKETVEVEAVIAAYLQALRASARKST